MRKDRKAFGNFLREMIKQTGISQATFYEAVEITKPYFYDILSGKVNPPPPGVQYKMIEKLNLDNQQKNEFLNLAAEGRDEIPADIARLITDHPQELDKIRITLKANTHKDNNEIPLRAKEVLPGMVGGHKKVISYFLRNGVASVTPFPVSAVLPRG